jgi:hypothetical protein
MNFRKWLEAGEFPTATLISGGGSGNGGTPGEGLHSSFVEVPSKKKKKELPPLGNLDGTLTGTKK